jgi:hypothetical protein
MKAQRKFTPHESKRVFLTLRQPKNMRKATIPFRIVLRRQPRERKGHE